MLQQGLCSHSLIIIVLLLLKLLGVGRRRGGGTPAEGCPALLGGAADAQPAEGEELEQGDAAQLRAKAQHYERCHPQYHPLHSTPIH